MKAAWFYVSLWMIICLALFASILSDGTFHPSVKAQTGSVIFLGAQPSTTKAVNCPAVPATPSECVVGDGVWIWQNATIGWCQPGISCPAPATAAVTSVTVNGGAAQTGAVLLTIPPAGVQKVNGTAPGATGNVNCPGGTTPQTGVTFSGSSSLSATVPAMTVTAAACTGS